MVSPIVFYKLLVPLLRCEVVDMRDSVVLALGTINHVAIMDLMSEVSIDVALRGLPLSTYAPRGRGGGGQNAYVVREVA